MKNLLPLVCLLLFAQTRLAAQTSTFTFFSDLEKIEIPVNGTFNVVYILEKKGSLPKEYNLEFPTWNGLERLGDPITSRRTSIIYGEITHSLITTLNFRAPSDPSKFIFPAATFTYGDTIIRSNPLKVVVIPFTDSLRVNQIYIKSELYPAKAMVGELVRLDVRVYGLNLPEISGYDLVNELQVEGLNIPKVRYRQHNRKEDIMVDGKMFPSHLICSIPVYAYHEGKFEIPSFPMGLSIKKDSSRASFFYSFRTEMVETNPIELEVVAMTGQDNPYPPLNGKEIIFELIDTALYRGQIKLDLTITGLGDPLFYTPPKLGLEKVARIQLDEITEKIARYPNKQDNQKIFEYTINFLEEGEFEIHPEWITWNTEQKNWDTIYAKPLKIFVPSKAVSSVSKKEKISVVEPEIPIPHDIIFAIDLSSSMLTQDFSPSRIDFIKERLKHFIKNESDLQRYGIVAFAGETRIICPLTSEVEVINQAIDKIEIGKLEDGTSIGDGLIHSLEVLSHSRALRRTIVLLTDGVQNSGKFDLLLSAKVARQKGVRIVSLGVGTKNDEAMVPIRRKANGDYIYGLTKNNKIDDEILKTITTKTNGVYLRVLEPSTFDKYLKQALEFRILELPRTEFPSPIDERLLDIYFKRFQWRNGKGILSF